MTDTPSANEAPPAADDSQTLYLLDAMSLAYRAHFVFISRPLINSKGQNTSASYGFVNSLLKLIEKHNMEHIAVVFDAVGEGGTFRDDIYDEYKAHRDPPPDELLENLPFIKEIVRALDIPVLEIEGVEADDVIGTLARQAEADDVASVIVSPDKDFQQLLSEKISIYKPARGDSDFETITAESFREEMGFEPARFADQLALWGDSSDNVPGVPLIGEKTSAKLLREYGTVEDVIEHAADVGGKRGENLAEHADQARLSKKLVTIKTDVDVDFDWHRLERHEADTAKLVELFSELEFSGLLNRLEEDEGLIRDGTLVEEAKKDVAASGGRELEFDFGPYEEVKKYDAEKVDYRIVRSREELKEVAANLAEQERFALDTETTSTDKMWASLVGLSFSWKEKTAYYVPTPLPEGTPTSEVVDLLRPALQNDALKIGHNLKYDLAVLQRHDLKVEGPLFDTMVANYLVAPEGQHALDDVARKYLSYRMISITEVIGEGKDQVSMRDVDIETVGPYACEDADATFRLEAPLREALVENQLLRVAEDMEFPLIPVLTAMELAGIRIDEKILDEISAALEGEMEGLEGKIYELAGESFNVNSTQQLSTILFEKLELPVVAKTSTGRPSTKESVLHELSSKHALPELVLDWRRLSKLKSTYVDSLGELVHPETGRIHTSFNQTITATGRLSSSQPNLQNIPVRTELGREVRRAFVPAEGWLLMAADYAQIELRILASISGDEALRTAFEEEEDIHTTTAALVFGIDPAEVTPDQRRRAKEVNYGIPYGISAWGLSQRLHSTVDEAQQLIDGYRRSYPGVSRYLALQVEQAREQGYVETKLGRRRFVPNIDSRNSNRRQFAERVAVNMPIQGTQADMIKIAMVRLHDRLAEGDLRARMLLQVHDELILEVPPEEQDEVAALLREEMVQALPLDVPVAVEVNTADNWLDAH